MLASFVMQMKLITKLQNMKPCTAESHHVDVILKKLICTAVFFFFFFFFLTLTHTVELLYKGHPGDRVYLPL